MGMGSDGLGGKNTKTISEKKVPNTTIEKGNMGITLRHAHVEDMILTLWKEFKKCYPSEAVAQQMLSKNTAVILPQLNSPAKIKGTYALLVKRLGKKQAQEIIQKNPGVLVCSPTALAKESDESIIKAANFVESVENNKPLITAASGLLYASIIGSFAYRIGTVGACPPGTC